MGLNATYQATTVVTGSGLAPGSAPPFADSAQTTPINTNAPPPQAYTLAGGGAISTLLIPSGYTVSRVQLMPIGSAPSNNAKSITDSGGVVVLPGWTAGSITLPATAGGSIYVQSAAGETLMASFS